MSLCRPALVAACKIHLPPPFVGTFLSPRLEFSGAVARLFGGKGGAGEGRKFALRMSLCHYYCCSYICKFRPAPHHLPSCSHRLLGVWVWVKKVIKGEKKIPPKKKKNFFHFSAGDPRKKVRVCSGEGGGKEAVPPPHTHTHTLLFRACPVRASFSAGASPLSSPPLPSLSIFLQPHTLNCQGFPFHELSL